MRKQKVLIVEDEHALAAALAAVVRRMGAEPLVEPSGSKAIARLRDTLPDAIVLDIGLPDMSGLDVLRECFGDEVPVPVLVVTAHANLENAIAARRIGIAEYLTKPLDLHQFEGSLQGLLTAPAGRGAEDGSAGSRVVETGEATLIGASPAMQPVFRDLAHACTVEAPVVITGDTGVGKSLAARVIHTNGPRPKGGLAVLDGADAGQETRELVAGLKRGQGGTLVVENVDELDPERQAELLRLVEAEVPGSGKGGSGRAPVRFISTAKGDLHEAVRSGRFRESLYYRLRVLDIRMPPLSERVEDIPALAAFFLGKACSERSVSLSPEALTALSAYSWPGNVWELRHAIEYAVSVCGGAQVFVQHLPVNVMVSGGRPGRGDELAAALAKWIEGELGDGSDPPPYQRLIDHLETLLLSDLLGRFEGKPTRLAEALEMNRTTLRKRCARLGLRGD